MTQKQIPILYSTPMVQATLEGRKTKTRRTKGLKIVNESPDDHEFLRLQVNKKGELEAIFHNGDEPGSIKCPYGKPGDLLWVRESFLERGFEGNYVYKADEDCPLFDEEKYKPSIHLPKKAARIWLEITDIRVERLQDITEEDAIKEGVKKYHDLTWFTNYTKIKEDDWVATAYASFATLWESINGEESWILNPWVWVISYNVLSTTGKPEFLEMEVHNAD